jgi:outer membrane protein OmpA-like peptidoglycan-associated protein
MKRVLVVAMAIGMMVSSGCLASHKYVNHKVKASSDALSADLNGKIDTTNGRVEVLDGNIKETRDSVDLVNRRVTDVDERVSTVDTRVSTVDGRLTTVDGKVTTVGNKVASVDERVTTLDTKANQTNQQLGVIKTEVNTVEVKTDQTAKDLTALDEKFVGRNNLTVSKEQSVEFGFDSSKLDKAGMAMLDEIAAMVAEDRDAIIMLEGRTDSVGNRDYNLALGERRVEQVRRYLAVDKNIPVYRIHQISLGQARPIAANDSAEGRKKNRSVTITILVPASTTSAAAANRTGQLP